MAMADLPGIKSFSKIFPVLMSVINKERITVGTDKGLDMNGRVFML